MSAQLESATQVLVNPADQILDLPILVLNVHSRCNCRCVMCDIWKRDESVEIHARDLERHRESLRRLSVRWVVLSGGEPLLHKDLGSLCRFFHQLNVHLTLLTTGLLLTKRAAEVAEMFDEIIVSIDGPETIHDTIRRVKGAFLLVESGIAAVRQHCPAMRITGRTTVQKANHHYLQEAVAVAKRIGLDSISFLAADLTSEAFNRSLLWPLERQNEIALTTGELRELEQEIEELIANYAEEIRIGYIAENALKLRRISTHFAAHLGLTKPRAPECNAPWVSAVVEADGSVRPCFFHRTIGNIHDSDLEHILNGEQGVGFRNALRMDENPVCQRCVCSIRYPNQVGSVGSNFREEVAETSN
jgi:MoaA/NifB/PqqE/SkfB family radical SAM enzyme